VKKLINMNIGDTVFVWWHGKPLQGVIVDNKEEAPLLAAMTAVRIPVQGVHVSALFMPHNVFATEKQLLAMHKEYIPTEVMAGPTVEQPTQRIILSTDTPSGDFFYNQIQEFKESHWDHEHNHLQVDALDEFYQLYCKVMAQKIGTTTNESDMKKEKVSKQCKACKYWEFTRTLSSMDKPEWHCRDGFSPSKDCQESAAYNDRCMQQHPNQRPAGWAEPAPIEYHKPTKPIEAVQLSLFD
jgi:hypothetical protein